MIINFTKKAIDAYHIQVETANEDPFFVWYAHLFSIGRSKCLMFMNEKTKLAFVVYDVKKKAFADLPLRFIEQFMEMLMTYKNEGDLILSYIHKMAEKPIVYSKGNNRAVLSCMTQRLYFHVDLWNGQPEDGSLSLTQMNVDLNDTYGRFDALKKGYVHCWDYFIDCLRVIREPDQGTEGVEWKS